jgi:hypothetical protein
MELLSSTLAVQRRFRFFDRRVALTVTGLARR